MMKEEIYMDTKWNAKSGSDIIRRLASIETEFLVIIHCIYNMTNK